MEKEIKPKKQNRNPERVALSPGSLSRLSQWFDDAQGRLRGSRINRGNLVDLLISNHSPQLSEAEFEQLEAQHFDQVRFAAWAFAQVKKAKAEGRNLSLADVINSAPSTNKKEGIDAESASQSKE